MLFVLGFLLQIYGFYSNCRSNLRIIITYCYFGYIKHLINDEASKK